MKEWMGGCPKAGCLYQNRRRRLEKQAEGWRPAALPTPPGRRDWGRDSTASTLLNRSTKQTWGRNSMVLGTTAQPGPWPHPVGQALEQQQLAIPARHCCHLMIQSCEDSQTGIESWFCHIPAVFLFVICKQKKKRWGVQVVGTELLHARLLGALHRAQYAMLNKWQRLSSWTSPPPPSSLFSLFHLVWGPALMQDWNSAHSSVPTTSQTCWSLQLPAQHCHLPPKAGFPQSHARLSPQPAL